MRPEPNLPQCTTNSSDCTVKTTVISDSHALLSECLPYPNCSIYGRINKDDIFTLVCPSSFNQHALQLGCCLGKNRSVRYFRVVTMSRRFFARISSFIHHVSQFYLSHHHAKKTLIYCIPPIICDSNAHFAFSCHILRSRLPNT